jgi:hypothetical protein
MPKDEGKRYEKYFQNVGMADEGHDMPERKSMGTDMKTNIRMQSSRR